MRSTVSTTLGSGDALKGKLTASLEAEGLQAPTGVTDPTGTSNKCPPGQYRRSVSAHTHTHTHTLHSHRLYRWEIQQRRRQLRCVPLGHVQERIGRSSLCDVSCQGVFCGGSVEVWLQVQAQRNWAFRYCVWQASSCVASASISSLLDAAAVVVCINRVCISTVCMSSDSVASQISRVPTLCGMLLASPREVPCFRHMHPKNVTHASSDCDGICDQAARARSPSPMRGCNLQ